MNDLRDAQEDGDEDEIAEAKEAVAEAEAEKVEATNLAHEDFEFLFVHAFKCACEMLAEKCNEIA